MSSQYHEIVKRNIQGQVSFLIGSEIDKERSLIVSGKAMGKEMNEGWGERARERENGRKRSGGQERASQTGNSLRVSGFIKKKFPRLSEALSS